MSRSQKGEERMSNKQQTAVEWLEKICNDRGYYLMSEYFEQAKAMHKEEIINSFFEGAYGGDNISGEQYYEQTYGDDKQ
jgi:hypothetical protein